jgi:hypothetical protein
LAPGLIGLSAGTGSSGGSGFLGLMTAGLGMGVGEGGFQILTQREQIVLAESQMSADNFRGDLAASHHVLLDREASIESGNLLLKRHVKEAVGEARRDSTGSKCGFYFRTCSFLKAPEAFSVTWRRHRETFSLTSHNRLGIALPRSSMR